MSVIRLAWLLILLCLRSRRRRDGRSEDRRLLVRHRRRRHADRAAVLFLLADLPALPGGQAVHRRTRGPESVARGQALLGQGQPRQRAFYFETAQALGVEALSVPGFVFCRQIMIGYDSAATTGKQLADALQACHERRLRTPARPILRATRRMAPAAGATAALGGRGEGRHDRQRAVRRSGGRQGALAARADAGAGGHGRVQSLRVLRAAVPAEPAGARQEPHAHGDRRRHLRAVLRTRLLRVHGRLAQRLPDRGRTARDHDHRGPDRADGRRAQHQGLLLVQGGPEPVDPGRGQARPVQAHARGRRLRQHGPDAGQHGAARDRRQLVRTAVHRRLPDGLHAGADARRPRDLAVLCVARGLQRDLRDAAARDRHGVHEDDGRTQAERSRGPPAQADLRLHDAGVRPGAADRTATCSPTRSPRSCVLAVAVGASLVVAKVAAPRKA